MTQLFARKPIADMASGDDPRSLKRVLGAGDLVMLAIGAVIGAGIFGAIGTAAAGQTGPDGEVIRYGAGPALVFSFLALGVALGAVVSMSAVLLVLQYSQPRIFFALAREGLLPGWPARVDRRTALRP